MGESSFQSAITAVLRPLDFAARDDFAKIDRVRDLDRTVSVAAEHAAELAIPQEAKDALKQIARSFSSAAEGDLAARVREAREALRPFTESPWSERQLANSTATLPGVGPKRGSGQRANGSAVVRSCERRGQATPRPTFRQHRQ